MRSGSAPTGRLELDNPMIDEYALNDSQGVQAIASGEIYYKRTDGADETPNAFSPYWQARLAPISSNELFAVMATQSPTLAWAFTGVSQSANSMSLQIQDKANEVWDEFQDGFNMLQDYIP
jgi:hypothetical protein